MKQKTYILGLITIFILISGTLFKINHFPGAGILITSGIISLELIFLPLALINNYRSGENRQYLSLYVVTWITAFIVFTAMLFKIQHWQGAAMMLMISLPFPYVIFLPVYLAVTSKIKNFNIYNTVFVMLVLAGLSGFSALLALSASKERIEESLSLSLHFNRFEKMLVNIPANSESKLVAAKHQELLKQADDLIKILDKTKDMLFTDNGLKEKQRLSDPGFYKNLDSRNALTILLKGNEPTLANQLDSGIKNFLNELNKTPDCALIAKLAPVILGISDTGDKNLQWAETIFGGNYLSWVIVDLDVIKCNLMSIRREISQI